MKCVVTFAVMLGLASSLMARKPPEYHPSEQEISAHRAEVFQMARDYIVETFNLAPIEECHFKPVRFNSTGVWGDFEARIKELGDDRFEVTGWIYPEGHGNSHIVWSVVIRYDLPDPNLWRYKRIDEEIVNEPEFLGWRYGHYRSVPYEAEYSEGFFINYRSKLRRKSSE